MAAAKKRRPGRGGSGVTHLGVRDDGERWWRARVTWKDPRTGKKREAEETYTADTKLDALRKRAELLKRKRDEVARPARKRFGEVADLWFATVRSAGSRISWGSHLKKLKAKFGDYWLDAMTTREMQAWLAGLRKADGERLGAGTQNSIRDVLVLVFEYAVAHGFADTNAARGTLRRNYRKERDATVVDAEDAPKRSLETGDEFVAFMTDLLEHESELAPMMLVQSILGCRFAEVSALRRADVDLSTGLVTVRRGQVRGTPTPTKGRYARTPALGPAGLQIVQEHLRRMDELRWPGHAELVFPRRPTGQATGAKAPRSPHWPYQTVYYALRRSFERLGLEMAAVTHAARHTMNNVASAEVAKAHISESLVRKVVGHTTVDMSTRYRHPELAEVISLAERVEGALLGPLAKSGATSGTSGAKRKR